MVGYYNYTVWLTYFSLICGSTGIAMCFVFPERPIFAVVCLLLSGFCDLFDGKIARTKKDRTDSEKAYGIQIDSLTDLVCFGVLPSVIMISMGMNELEGKKVFWFLPLALMFILFGMIRLAYFNVKEAERQVTEEALTNSFFSGVPITMSSLVMPIVFCIARFLVSKELISSLVAFIIYCVFLFILGLAFVIKIKVVTPKKKGAIIMVSIGAAVILALLLLEIFC